MQAAGPGGFEKTCQDVEASIKNVIHDAEEKGFKPAGSTSGEF